VVTTKPRLARSDRCLKKTGRGLSTAPARFQLPCVYLGRTEVILSRHCRPWISYPNSLAHQRNRQRLPLCFSRSIAVRQASFCTDRAPQEKCSSVYGTIVTWQTKQRLLSQPRRKDTKCVGLAPEKSNPRLSSLLAFGLRFEARAAFDLSRGTMSPEGRARIVAAQKARWAKKK